MNDPAKAAVERAAEKSREGEAVLWPWYFGQRSAKEAATAALGALAGLATRTFEAAGREALDTVEDWLAGRSPDERSPSSEPDLVEEVDRLLRLPRVEANQGLKLVLSDLRARHRTLRNQVEVRRSSDVDLAHEVVQLRQHVAGLEEQLRGLKAPALNRDEHLVKLWAASAVCVGLSGDDAVDKEEPASSCLVLGDRSFGLWCHASTEQAHEFAADLRRALVASLSGPQASPTAATVDAGAKVAQLLDTPEDKIVEAVRSLKMQIEDLAGALQSSDAQVSRLIEAPPDWAKEWADRVVTVGPCSTPGKTAVFVCGFEQSTVDAERGECAHETARLLRNALVATVPRGVEVTDEMCRAAIDAVSDPSKRLYLYAHDTWPNKVRTVRTMLTAALKNVHGGKS